MAGDHVKFSGLKLQPQVWSDSGRHFEWIFKGRLEIKAFQDTKLILGRIPKSSPLQAKGWGYLV